MYKTNVMVNTLFHLSLIGVGFKIISNTVNNMSNTNTQNSDSKTIKQEKVKVKVKQYDYNKPLGPY